MYMIENFVGTNFWNTVAWVTLKQNCVTLPSSGDELVALCTAVQDLIWFRKLIIYEKLDFKTYKMYENN